MPGPWVKLATPLRTLALDVVLVLLRPTGDEEAQESVSLREAITAAVMGTEEEAYWVRAEEAIRS
jgi:flagellar biosynthesis regulator FlbT